jgi:hypothetical protein
MPEHRKRFSEFIFRNSLKGQTLSGIEEVQTNLNQTGMVSNSDCLVEREEWMWNQDGIRRMDKFPLNSCLQRYVVSCLPLSREPSKRPCSFLFLYHDYSHLNSTVLFYFSRILPAIRTQLRSTKAAIHGRDSEITTSRASILGFHITGHIVIFIHYLPYSCSKSVIH